MDDYRIEEICEYLGLKCKLNSWRVQIYIDFGFVKIGIGYEQYGDVDYKLIKIATMRLDNVTLWLYRLGFCISIPKRDEA